MKHEVSTQWMGKMQFNALVNNHTVIMDTSERSGGSDLGPTPKPLLLSALAGCTGMDIIALMHKKGLTPESLNIKTEAQTGKTTPIEYVSAHVVYEIKGRAEDEPAALEAVQQSQEMYCGVSHMLKRFMPITWQVVYNDREVFNNRT